MSHPGSPFERPAPVACMITGGISGPLDFGTARLSILAQIELAARTGVQIVQIREKSLTARQVYELAKAAASICRNSETHVLINDRFDIAMAAGVSGVHLTSDSLKSGEVRRIAGGEFLIGVSVHSVEEARDAAAEGADYVIFGPVFDTPSKREYGEPKGTSSLKNVCAELCGFPVIAIGGIDLERSKHVIKAGARGFAAIRMFENADSFSKITHLK